MAVSAVVWFHSVWFWMREIWNFLTVLYFQLAIDVQSTFGCMNYEHVLLYCDIVCECKNCNFPQIFIWSFWSLPHAIMSIITIIHSHFSRFLLARSSERRKSVKIENSFYNVKKNTTTGSFLTSSNFWCEWIEMLSKKSFQLKILIDGQFFLQSFRLFLDVVVWSS